MQAILEGKNFDIRKIDGNFEKGDQIVYREWDAGACEYTGRTHKATIVWVANGGKNGLEAGWCCLGLGPAYTGTRGTDQFFN